MDYSDRKILENQLAVPLGKAISQWAKKNGITQPVEVTASLLRPSCYIDEQGVSHIGNLITVDCEVIEDDDIDDDE